MLRLERGLPGEGLLEFEMGNRRIPVPDGIHFGSVCPVDPERKAIYDFLPTRLFDKLVNLPDLLMAYVFDKWVNQIDTRQAIFVRERSASGAGLFRTYIIDHGLSFGGSRWQLSDNPLTGLYHNRSIYERPDFETISHANVDKIQQLSEDALFSIEKEIPADWLREQNREEMTRLLELLCNRRGKLHDTIDRALRQLQEAGVKVPLNSQNRYVFGVFLLLLCIPKSASVRTGLHLDVTTIQNLESLNTANTSIPGVGFHFVCSTGESTIRGDLRIWEAERTASDTTTRKTGGEGQKVSVYAFHTYPESDCGVN